MISERVRPETAPTEQTSKGLLLVITGATGAGKDATMNGFLQSHPEFKPIVTYASRDKRPSETAGVDYHFVTDKKFKKLIRRGHMAEWIYYDKHYKGTSCESIEQVLSEKNAIWRIDIFRAGHIDQYFKEKFPEKAKDLRDRTLVVFIGVPRLYTLYDRFRKRDPKAQKSSFLNRIRPEWKQYKEGTFDHVIINNNGDLGKTVETLINAVQSKLA